MIGKKETAISYKYITHKDSKSRSSTYKAKPAKVAVTMAVTVTVSVCVWCDIRTEITINLQPFLILNWTAELGDRMLKRSKLVALSNRMHAYSVSFAVSLSHCHFNPDVITVQ